MAQYLIFKGVGPEESRYLWTEHRVGNLAFVLPSMGYMDPQDIRTILGDWVGKKTDSNKEALRAEESAREQMETKDQRKAFKRLRQPMANPGPAIMFGEKFGEGYAIINGKAYLLHNWKGKLQEIRSKSVEGNKAGALLPNIR